jgi:hypothetical protein
MLHKPDAPGPYTDGDIVAVRFPYRTELADSPQGAMKDHDLFEPVDSHPRIQFYLTEVKFSSSPPRLNRSWLDSDTVMTEFLRRFGLFPAEKVSEVVQSLRKDWMYEDSNYIVRVVVVARRQLQDQSTRMPLPVEQQLTWDRDILPFIYLRFQKYQFQKRVHSQWDETAHVLFQLTLSHESPESFVREVLERRRSN